MKKSRFTEQQIIQILAEGAAGAQVAELCRKNNISGTTYYQWKAKFDGMTVPEAKRLKSLESENSRLKTLVAELYLDVAALKGVLAKKW